MNCKQKPWKIRGAPWWPDISGGFYFQDKRIDQAIDQTRARVTQKVSAAKNIGCLVVVIVIIIIINNSR